MIHLELSTTNCTEKTIVKLYEKIFFVCLIYFSYFRQSGDDYSQFLNDYPGRFKIEYASPDDVNGLCFKNNHVQYDTSVTHRPNRYAVS